jgi:hypothetical protein
LLLGNSPPSKNKNASPSKRNMGHTKPHKFSNLAPKEHMSLTSGEKSKGLIDVNNQTNSNYKGQIEYNFKSESSPTRFLGNFSSEDSALRVSRFQDITKYVDTETRNFIINNSISKADI